MAKKEKEEMELVSVRLGKKDLAKIKRFSKTLDCTPSELIRMLIHVGFIIAEGAEKKNNGEVQ